MKTSLFLLGAIGAQACQRERAFVHHSHPHVKRQTSNYAFPPTLDPNEQILLNSFDNTSISEWSYYYSAAFISPTRQLLIARQHMAIT
jgi:N-acetylated-alpha-linked acidic dipeptidase